MIDLHNHLLPGIDDGPATIGESVEMARAAWESGIPHRGVHAPHGREVPHRAPPRVVGRGRVARGAGGCRDPLDIRTGGEIAIDYVDGMSDQELDMASVGGGGKWLLLEMPFTAAAAAP